MAFFFEAYYQRIDWSKGYQTLDKEMTEITEEDGLGKQSADKLFKVQLLNGEEEYLLLHLEVQGYADKQFAERVQRYNWLIRLKYKTTVRSFALLTDPDPKFRPEGVHIEDSGFVETFRFPTVKLLDYWRRWDELEASPNPFALVVMAHLQALKLKNRPIQLKEAKLQLVRLLFERGYNRDDVIKLLRFIAWLVSLPKDLEKEFQIELRQLKGEEKMKIVTNYEIVLQEIAQQEAKLESLTRLIEAKFGLIAESLKARLKPLDAAQLDNLMVSLLKFNSLDEVTAWLDNQGV